MPNFFVVNIVNLILLAGVIFYSVKKNWGLKVY